MKTKDFNIIWTNSTGSGISEWANMDLTKEDIDWTLEEVLNSNENSQVELPLTFNKNEFSPEFIESLMSIDSQVFEETDTEIEIIWSLYH